MDIDIKDRVKDVEYLRLALNCCDLAVDYKTSLLIHLVSEKIIASNGNCTINEIVNINCEWKRNVEKYFEQTKKE